MEIKHETQPSHSFPHTHTHTHIHTQRNECIFNLSVLEINQNKSYIDWWTLKINEYIYFMDSSRFVLDPHGLLDLQNIPQCPHTDHLCKHYAPIAYLYK